MVCKYQITECWEVTCLGVKTFPLRDGVGSCNPNVECKVPAHSDAQQITALNYWVPMLKTWIITILFLLFKSLTLFSLLCFHCQFLYKSIIFYLIYWRETWRQWYFINLWTVGLLLQDFSDSLHPLPAKVSENLELLISSWMHLIPKLMCLNGNMCLMPLRDLDYRRTLSS